MADERTRIARELHDLIAHSVSLMGIQASAARRMLDPGADGPRDALLAVESTSGQALAEMHPMLGVLRPGDEEMTLSPPPSLDQLEELVGTVKAAGLRVDLVIDGKRRQLSPGLELSAYRTVQSGGGRQPGRSRRVTVNWAGVTGSRC